MASSSEVLNDKANGCRLSRLLVDKGTQIMRAAFDVIHPPSTLAAAMSANKRKLTALRYRVINKSQWELLFPASGVPDSQNFDITLLTVLLREICGLASPATGWKVMPPDTDISIAANILRIKLYRNEVYAHIKSTEFEDSIFETLWQKISKALVGLGVSKSELDKLKEASLSPEEADYIRQLEVWYKKEAELIEISLDTNAAVRDTQAKIRKLEKVFEQRSRASETVSDVDKLGKCDFSGEIRSLNKMFFPGTREWLFDKLDTWFNDKDSDSTVMILIAGPGVGKSVFAAKVCQMYTDQRQLAACHFCKYNSSDYRNPRMIIESLASNMCNNVSGFKAKLTEQLKRGHSRNTLSDKFRVLLNDPLHALEEREPMLLVIDALDESQVDSRSEFLELISEEFSKLPQWIKILITSRPELSVQEELQHLNPEVITPHDSNNEKDLHKFLRNNLSQICDSDSALESLTRLCEGSFLFAYHAQMELKKMAKLLTKENFSELVPKGLSGFYKKQFKRLTDQLSSLALPEFNLKRFLQVLVAAKDPLPLDILPECLGLPCDTEYEVRRVINEVMSTIFPVYDDCLKVYHKSLVDWLTSDGYKEHALTVNSQSGHPYLWRACEKVFNHIVSSPLSELKPTPLIKYALANGIFHMIQTSDEASFHWSVELKIVLSRITLLDYFEDKMIDEWVEIVKSSSLSSVVLHELKWHIRCFESFFSCKSPEFYLQSIANRIDFVGNDCDKRSAAKALLKTNHYFWFEELEATYLANHVSQSVSVRADVTCIGVAPDQQLVAVGYWDGWISIFKLPKFEELHIFDTVLEPKFHCCDVFSPRLYMLVYDKNERFPFWYPGEDLPAFGGNYGAVWSCAFSPSGNQLVTCDGSEELKLWNVSNGNCLQMLKAGGLVDCCSFSECGLFILASKQRANNEISPIEENDVFTAWNALTLQRVDRRHVLSKFKCFPDTKIEIFLSYDGYMIDVFHLPKALSYCQLDGRAFSFLLPVTRFHWRDCVLYHTNESIELSQLDQLETMAWDQGSEVKFNDSRSISMFIDCSCRKLKLTRVVPVKVQGLYVVPSFARLNIFNVADQSKIVSCISRSYFITCCCFSPDGSFLATCANGDPLTILVWDTKLCAVVQVIRLPLSYAYGCWWSTMFYLINDEGLVKISFSNRCILDPASAQRVEIDWKPLRLLTFSDVLIFNDERDFANVIKIIDGVVHYKEKLPVNESMTFAAVSPNNSVILVANPTTIHTCTEVQTVSSSHWVTLDVMNIFEYPFSGGSERRDSPPNVNGDIFMDCYITNDATKAVLSQENLIEKIVLRRFLVDLNSGKIMFERRAKHQKGLHTSNLFYITDTFWNIEARKYISGQIIVRWKKSVEIHRLQPLINCKNDIVAVIAIRRPSVTILRLKVSEE